MDRAPISVFNSTIRVCADCAHFQAEHRECGVAPYVDKITGATSFKDASNERIWGCGEKAVHFVAKSNLVASKYARRAQIQLAIEAAITDLHPDTVEAQEILGALIAAIRSRYEDNAEDALTVAAEFHKALDEVEEREVVAEAKQS